MSEVVIYQAEDGRSRLEVHLDRDTVWLSQENWKRNQFVQNMHILLQTGKHKRSHARSRCSLKTQRRKENHEQKGF
jgi:hypothetical protein